ncbi:MAG: DUF86 domain-containing protein [Planctomycetaceae bacterium]|jgi:uncharacterized protein with HEPN domain|nr:DUF86 domain-containing protein [Planctomycetaceae bacterium]
MDDSVKKHLEDILIAIEEVESFMPSEKRYDDFLLNLQLRRAAERNIVVIGEAMNRFVQCKTGIDVTNSRKIIDTRNRFIHGYDTVSPDMIWSIIVKHLPLLKHEIQELLQMQ